MAAARVAGMARGCDAAMAGWASATEERTTAGRAAVVAAIRARLGLAVCFGERVVMEKVLFSAANAAGLAGSYLVNSVTHVIAVTNVVHENLS
jgi:hypothetical protein